MDSDYKFKEGRNKNIVICSDGTWNSPQDMDRGVPSPTNVYRVYSSALTSRDSNAATVPQLKWYDGGLGAQLGRWGKLLNFIGGVVASWAPGAPFLSKLGVFAEGATGLGISQNICEAYTWLCKVYQPGDRIFLFGFSRGAFTVRSLSGMIYHVGLMRSEYVSDVPLHYKRYRQWSKEIGENAESDKEKRAQNIIKDSERIHDREKLRIHFLGVWDTVAALGIPLWGWSFEIFRIRTAFHDPTLVPIIDNAYHAVAMDELRSSFMPILLKAPPESIAKPRFEQLWFRGTHADIGGGYARTCLSDIALQWILEKAVACGLRVDNSIFESLASDPLGPLHDAVARSPGYTGAGLWPRMFPVDHINWHPSVVQRAKSLCQLSENESLGRLDETEGWDWLNSRYVPPGQQIGPETPKDIDPHSAYDPRERVWRELSVNDAVRVRVRGDLVWCATGVILKEGDVYDLEAVGSWADREELSGPEGRTTWQSYKSGILMVASLKSIKQLFYSAPNTFGLVVRLPSLLGVLLKMGLRLLRSIFFSVKAITWWAKRDIHASWLELIGMINEPTDWQRRTLGVHWLLWYLIFDDPRELSVRQFRIGKHALIKTQRSGPLYCFANDAWVTYGNNSGSVVLTIKRLPNQHVPAVSRHSDVRSALLPWIINLPATFMIALVVLLFPLLFLDVGAKFLWQTSAWLVNLVIQVIQDLARLTEKFFQIWN